MAAGGCGGCGLMAGPAVTAMGIESFFRLQPIEFAWLRKIRERRESQLKAFSGGMTSGA